MVYCLVTLPYQNNVNLKMLFHRIFIYWIEKRKWKYVFLLSALEDVVSFAE